ncbi:MAG TPA: ABC transporter ATP-binding protein [Longimicrobiaceae bacterium]|nr:ABC transporter ATP-binding protein [Longimicrobiaceae bacterium]
MRMGTVAIRADELCRRFGNAVALGGLSLVVETGEVFGFLGHNGAGKTTTVRLLNGVLAPSSGSVTVLGLNPAREGARLRLRTGVLTETPALDGRLTAREALAFAGEMFGVDPREVPRRIAAVLDEFGLAERADERVSRYSKGMRQRLALARAILHGPELVFLDEPTGGLDPVARLGVHALVRRLARGEGRTVFLCTHDLAEAQALCDRVAVLQNGELIALGTPAELAARLGQRSALELEVAVDQMPAAQAALGAMGFDVALDAADHIMVPGVERRDIPSIVARLASEGVLLYRIAPCEATLEDAYLALVAGSDR